jgi:DegT/DnrJ/EryC1/StrS aminotransferase family protein
MSVSDVKFQPILRSGRLYPSTRVPQLQTPSIANWIGSRTAVTSAFLSSCESFSVGRSALLEALRRSGIGPGAKVLAPAFHCRSMVDPVIRLGAQPVFYDLTKGLWLDEVSVEAQATGATALILAHYFGFPSNLAFASKFCADRRIVLIEDCAHALYGEHEGAPLGTTGQYAIASAWKFLPSFDGGLLRDNTHRVRALARAPGLGSEVSGLLQLARGTARRVLADEGTSEPNAREFVAEARRALKTPLPVFSTSDSLSSTDTSLAGLRTSRWILRTSRHGRIAEKRRRNYEAWLKGTKDVLGATPLFPELPPTLVPYAFPLLLSDPEPAFSALKMAGIPMWRWEDMAETTCSTANHYREHLIQLPLHQELSESQVAWMISTVRSVLAELHG